MEELFMHVFERRDRVAAQMRQQVVSYSDSLACTLLAAGHRPPPWLLPRPAPTLPTQGNTLKKPYLDVAQQENAAGVHHALPETHKMVEKGTLEFDGLKPGRSHIPNCSETVSQCKKRVSETVNIELTAACFLNEDPSSTNGHEASHYVVSPPLQKDRLHSVKANLHEVPYLITGSLAARETTRAAETAFEGPTSMNSSLLKNSSVQCVKPNYLEGPDSVVIPPLEKDAVRTVDTSSLQGPHSTADCPVSPQHGNDLSNTVEHTKELTGSRSFSDRSINETSKILDQIIFHAPCNLSSLQPDHLTNITSGAPEIFGMPQDNMLDVDSGSVQHLLEDGCGHYSHSKLSDAFSKCSLAKSATSHEELWPKFSNDNDVYQASIISSGAMINHNDSISVCATNAFIPAQNKPSQMPSSLAESSLEFDRTGIVVDAHMISANQWTSNEGLQKEPVVDSVNSYSEQSGHAQARFSSLSEAYDVSAVSNTNESLSPEVSGALLHDKNARVLYITERESTISANKCLRRLHHEGNKGSQVMNDKILSPRPFAQHLLCTSGQSRSGEMGTAFKSDVENAAGHLDRSTGSGIQPQGNSSCETAVTSCRSDCVLYSSSSTPSLDCQDDIHDQLETRTDLLQRPQPSVNYYLNSSESGECIIFNSKGRSDGSNWKSLVASEVHASASSSPERSMARPSDVISCNSARMKASSCNGSSRVHIVPQCSQSHSLRKNLDAVTNSSSSSSNILPNGDERCITKLQINSCFEHPDADVKSVTVEDQLLAQMDYGAYGSEISNPENYSSTTSPTMHPGYHLDQHSQQACALHKSIQEKSSHGSNPELYKTCVEYDPEQQPVPDDAILWQNGNNYPDCDGTVQQRQSFCIPIPSSSPTNEERVFDAFCNSTKLVNMSSSLCLKYKMNSEMETLISDVYQPLLARFEKLMNKSSLDDTKWRDERYDTNKLGVSGKYSLELDDSFLMPNVLTNSSNAESIHGDSEIPLTPSVDKYSMEKLSGRSVSTSECMGSIPESTCFQIGEDTNIAEEIENQEKLPGFLGISHSSQCPTGRKLLEHVTSSYQSTEKSTSLSTRHVDVGRLDLKATKTHSTEPDHHLRLRADQAIKNTKENCGPLTRKEGNLPQTLHDRANKIGILGSKNERHGNEANLEKGCKASNIVTNMTSFIPLVKQKQYPTAVKKNVRVKALEAAEATKRRAEKKQNEREMRKVAAELERIRLKQEREDKQNLVEQKKMDANIVIRKRHMEDVEKREKEKKKKCTEEAWKQQKQQLERTHAANGKKDACRKGNKELGKDFVGGVKMGLIPDNRAETVLRFVASESNNTDGSQRSESSGLQSYEMSPYEDSDEEDDSDVEHKEEVRRRRKLIPLWAWKESLDKILLSNQTSDPRKFFERKCSFNLSDVLPVHIPQRRFN